MKTRPILHSFIIGLTTIILNTSCTKDATHTQQVSQQPAPKDFNLVASHWQLQSQVQIYMDAFPGVLQGDKNPHVYIETGDDEILISAGGVSFMDGEVWSTQSGSDLAIYYRNFSQQGVPFGYLNIKVAY